MRKEFSVEISVESVEAAMAAERGGASRIEFCSHARVGGTTPSDELLRTVRKRVSLPNFSMVRPRGGNFFYGEAEFEDMRRDVDAAKEIGMDGVVLGLLDADGQITSSARKSLLNERDLCRLRFIARLMNARICDGRLRTSSRLAPSGFLRLEGNGRRPRRWMRWGNWFRSRASESR